MSFTLRSIRASSPTYPQGPTYRHLKLTLHVAWFSCSQPVKDDIGDKSVFVFSAMSPEQQRQTILLMQRNLQQGEGTADKGNSETAGQANGSERGHQ